MQHVEIHKECGLLNENPKHDLTSSLESRLAVVTACCLKQIQLIYEKYLTNGQLPPNARDQTSVNVEK